MDSCPPYAPGLDSKLPRWLSLERELQDRTSAYTNSRRIGLNGPDGQLSSPQTLDSIIEEYLPEPFK